MFRKRTEYKVFPTDTRPNTGIGIRIPFGIKNPFIINYTTQDQIKSNLINFIMTNRGERVFNPDFGSDIRSYLFEQFSSFEELRLMILDRISLYIPDITVIDLSFINKDDENILYVILKYSFNRIEDSITLQINR